MALQFNQSQQPSQQGIASLPVASSAQGGFAFRPQQAIQHPSTLQPRAQPLTNEQLGVTPQQQSSTAADAFAQSMQAWQAARQAELAGIKGSAATATTQPSARGLIGGSIGSIGSAMPTSIMDRFSARANTGPAQVQAPTIPEFSTAPIPTDPQQYMQYVQQQQEAFNKQKADYQAALDAYTTASQSYSPGQNTLGGWAAYR